MARVVAYTAARSIGKKSLSMQSFAQALSQIPFILCENAGMDSSDILSELGKDHLLSGPLCRKGVDVIRGQVGDMKEFCVFEAFIVKLHIILSATEAAECILRVDETIRNPPKHRES
jgi:T-complex protein 1 subunit beta